MNDVLRAQELQHFEELDAEALDEAQVESLEVLGANELIQVDGEHFKADAQVASEPEVVGHLDDCLFIVRILQASCE